MTRADLSEWFRNHGCIMEQLSHNTTGNAIKVINPKNGSHVFMNLPIDERPVKHYSACQQCTMLGIEIPKECEYMNGFVKEIKNKHFPNF